MDVVDVLSALAMREQGVKSHDGTAVHDEAHLALERAVEPLGEIGEHLFEKLAREGDFVQSVEHQHWRKCRQVRFGRIALHFGKIWKGRGEGDEAEGSDGDGVQVVAW